MLEERGTAVIENRRGYIVPVGRNEQVKFVPADFRTIANGDDVRFWRFPGRIDWAQYVLPLHDAFDAGRLVALAGAGAGLTPRAADYLELRTAKLLVEAHRDPDEAQTRQRIDDVAGALTRIAGVRSSGAAPLGVRTVRNALAKILPAGAKPGKP